jgi:Cysteine-rich secretory protein family
VNGFLFCQKFSSNCPRDATLVRLTSAQKKMFVDQQNQLRSQVATGNLRGFNTANKMPELQWDDELAYFAELNVKQCKMSHDACHNTYAFPYSGQNLASLSAKPNFQDDNEAIASSVRMWFDEYKDADMSKAFVEPVI